MRLTHDIYLGLILKMRQKNRALAGPDFDRENDFLTISLQRLKL